MDLDAILAPDPEVALVDELAHTNVPGSRHEKRWQDVEALLDAGIEVITTVNIQHLESLNDVDRGRSPGSASARRSPTTSSASADQIELVDMSPQALRRRMAHGNIYPADKIDAALSNYFREGNLTALRELALLWLADRVDEGLERYRDQHEIDAHLGHPRAHRRRPHRRAGVGHVMRRAAQIASPPVRRRVAGALRHAPGRLAGIDADPLTPARAPRPRSSAARSTRSSGRRGRGDPRLRARRERHPDRHRRQPPRPGLDPAATRRRRAGGRRVRRHRRPPRHPRLRRPRPERSLGDDGLGRRRRLVWLRLRRRSAPRSEPAAATYRDLHGLPLERCR